MALQAEKPRLSTKPLAGTVLIVVGCVQLIFSAFAIAGAVGAAGFEVLAMLVQALFAASSGRREIEGTPGADRFVDAALNIGILGFVFATLAVVTGILVLRDKQIAWYFLAADAAFAFLLAYRNLAIAWYLVATVYAVLGTLLVAFVVLQRRSSHL